MTNELSKQEVKFHAIKGTGREWIEYPSDLYIMEDTRDEGYYILCCANILKDQPTLVQELKELYGTEVDVVEKWIRIEVLRTPTGKIVKQKSIIHNCTPPIIKEGFTHSLSFHGTDKNYLEFIKWDIEKKLADRKKLANLDIKVDEPVVEEVAPSTTEPSFKISDSVEKSTTDSVDIPHFLNASAKEEKKTAERSLDAVFDDIEKIMDDFFKDFPKF